MIEEIPAEIGVTEETITEPSEIMPSDSVLGSSASLLFIRLVGPPLTRFDPARYVDSWLLRGRHSAIPTAKNAVGNVCQTRTWSNFGVY